MGAFLRENCDYMQKYIHKMIIMNESENVKCNFRFSAFSVTMRIAALSGCFFAVDSSKITSRKKSLLAKWEKCGNLKEAAGTMRRNLQHETHDYEGA